MPEPPLHGSLVTSGDNTVGSTISLACSDGFILMGETVIRCVTSSCGIIALSSKILFRCTESGDWSHQIPFCKRACRFPGPRDNADITPLKFRSDMTHPMIW